jgi:hypothetical protein
MKDDSTLPTPFHRGFDSAASNIAFDANRNVTFRIGDTVVTKAPSSAPATAPGISPGPTGARSVESDVLADQYRKLPSGMIGVKMAGTALHVTISSIRDCLLYLIELWSGPKALTMPRSRLGSWTPGALKVHCDVFDGSAILTQRWLERAQVGDDGALCSGTVENLDRDGNAIESATTNVCLG